MGTFSAALVALTYNFSTASHGTSLYTSNGDSSEVDLAFIRFLTRFQKSYLTQAEFEARKAVFKVSYDYVMKHNEQEDLDFYLSLNRYAD